jgi:hypothetical protein
MEKMEVQSVENGGSKCRKWRFKVGKMEVQSA